MLRATFFITLPRSSTRSLHVSPIACKSVTEKVKEAASTVNLKVGQKLAKGLEKGEQVTHRTQQAASTAKEKAQETAGTAKTKADQSSEAARQKANQASADARQAKDDFLNQMQE